MSDVRDPERDQPLPARGHLPVQSLLMGAIAERRDHGLRKYGRPLETGNGRDPLTGLWEELLDALSYLTQIRLERGDTITTAQLTPDTDQAALQGGATAALRLIEQGPRAVRCAACRAPAGLSCHGTEHGRFHRERLWEARNTTLATLRTALGLDPYLGTPIQPRETAALTVTQPPEPSPDTSSENCPQCRRPATDTVLDSALDARIRDALAPESARAEKAEAEVRRLGGMVDEYGAGARGLSDKLREANAALERVRQLHDHLNTLDGLTSPDDPITRGAAAERIATALDGQREDAGTGRPITRAVGQDRPAPGEGA